MPNLTIQDLEKHLATYKDAVFIIGDRALEKPANLFKESEILNNKVLRREPDKFWEYFKSNIYVDSEKPLTPALKAVMALYNKGYVKDIVNLTNDARLNSKVDSILNLHGTVDKYKCVSCKTIFTDQYVMSFDTNPECEVCGKALRPDILLDKENYYDDKFHALKHLILETHTVFLVGFGWNEDPVTNLVMDFSDMKEDRNVREKEQRMLITVGGSDFYDVTENGKFEFYVPGDVNESMERLINNL